MSDLAREINELARLEGNFTLRSGRTAVTSGGQVIVSADDLRRLGARIDHALCVIDRQEGGAQALAVQGIELIALFTRADLERA